MNQFDRLVADYILNNIQYFKFEPDHSGHILNCNYAVTDLEGGDGYYGCETGCEYYRLTATVRCACGIESTIEYGDFGQLANIIDELDGIPSGVVATIGYAEKTEAEEKAVYQIDAGEGTVTKLAICNTGDAEEIVTVIAEEIHHLFVTVLHRKGVYGSTLVENELFGAKRLTIKSNLPSSKSRLDITATYSTGSQQQISGRINATQQKP